MKFICFYIVVNTYLFGRTIDAFLFEKEDAVEDVKWDSLRIRFGFPFSKNFKSQPRTASDALVQGYVKISDCDASSNALWRGDRYIKDNDFSLILLYDVNGYIAGTQTAVPVGSRNGYPQSKLRGNPFVLDEENDQYVITGYFVNPDIICTTGRSSSEFDSQGTGDNLYIQNGTNPEEDSLLIPRQETNLENTGWKRGKCFYTMGVHYWYGSRRDQPCDELFPVFLLYHQGQLKAFGWAMIINLRSPTVEHVAWPVFPFFISPVPRCLPFQGIVTSQHIYMVDDVFSLKCQGERFIPQRLQ